MQLGDVSSSNLFFGQVHADDVNQLLYDYPARIENPRGPSHPHSTTKELVRRLSTQSRRSSHSRRSDRKPKPSRRVSSSSSHFVQQAPHSRHSRLRPSHGNRDSPRRHSGSAVEHRHNSSGDVCGSSAPHSSSYSPLKDKRGGHRRTGTDQSKRRHHGHHSHHRKRHTQMMRNGSHNDGHNSPAEDPKNPHATNHSNNKGDVERLDDHEQRRRQAAQPQKPEVDEETNGNADENAPNGAAPANGANGKAPEGKSIPKLAHTNIEVGMRLKRWMIVSRIGAGSFGETFAGVEVSNDAFMESVLTVTPEAKEFLANLPTNPPLREVCIKVEQQNKNVLRLESLAIKRLQCCPQIARYFGSGSYAGTNFLVMERLGPNLADLRRRTPHGTFNIYTTLVAGISCLTAIRGVHDQGIVHRDIKPSNFVIGLPGSGAETTCFLIDFGLARRFRRGTGDIRPPRENAGFRGTSRYAALNSHLHKDLGRVDDLWSLLFMLVEFATGTLPWRKCKEKDDIGKCKAESITPHLVRNLPREFQPFLQHLQGLKYEDEPDYDLLLALLHRSMERRGYSANKPVDWLMDPEQIANEELLARPTPVAVAPASPPATQPARMLPTVEAVVGPANPVVVAAAEPQEAPHASGVPTPAEPEPHRQPTHVVERASDVGEARKLSAAAPPTVAATSSSPQQQPHSSTRRLQPPTQEEVAHSALAANPGRESDTNVQISGTSAVDEEDGDFSPCERPAKLVAQRTKTGDAVSAASDAAAASIPAASSSPPPKHFGADPKPKPNKLAKDGCGCNCTVM